MSWLYLGVVIVALAARSYSGFGFSVIFVSVLGPVEGYAAVVPQAIAYEFLLSSLLAYRYRRRLQLGRALLLKLFAGVGGVFGGLSSDHVSKQSIMAISGIVVGLAAASELLHVRSSVLRRTGVQYAPIAGLVSGYMGYFSSMTGPAIVIHYSSRRDEQEDIRGQLAGYFIILYSWLLVMNREVIGDQISRNMHEAILLAVLVLIGFLVFETLERRWVPHRFKNTSARAKVGNLLLLLCGTLLVCEALLG